MDSSSSVLSCSSCGCSVSFSVADLLPGPSDSAFSVLCSACSSSGVSSLRHTEKSWVQRASTALFNMHRAASSGSVSSFNAKSIAAFLVSHRDELLAGLPLSFSELEMRRALFSALESSPGLFFRDSHGHRASLWSLHSEVDASNCDHPFKPKPKKARTSSPGCAAKSASAAPAVVSSPDSGDRFPQVSVASIRGKRVRDSVLEVLAVSGDGHELWLDSSQVEPSAALSKFERGLASTEEAAPPLSPEESPPEDDEVEMRNCHQCHNRNAHFMSCTRCPRAFCANCIRRHRYDFGTVLAADYICARCREICRCAACKRRFGDPEQDAASRSVPIRRSLSAFSEDRRLRTSDFDSDRIIFLEPYTFQPLPRPAPIPCPVFREICEPNERGPDVSVVLDDEDTSDELYARLHEEMKEKLLANFNAAVENARSQRKTRPRSRHSATETTPPQPRPSKSRVSMPVAAAAEVIERKFQQKSSKESSAVVPLSSATTVPVMRPSHEIPDHDDDADAAALPSQLALVQAFSGSRSSVAKSSTCVDAAGGAALVAAPVPVVQQKRRRTFLDDPLPLPSLSAPLSFSGKFPQS